MTADTVVKPERLEELGAVIRADGKLAAVAADIGEKHPHGAELVQFLQGALKAQFDAGQIVAAAVAADVNIPPTYGARFPDGIRVLLEAPGHSRFVYLPYRVAKPGFLRRLSKAELDCEFGDSISVDVPATIAAGTKGA